MADKNPGKVIRRLSMEEKAKIIAWKSEGVQSTAIAARLGRHRASIDRLLARAATMEEGTVPERQKGAGRPRKLDKTILAIIKRQATKYPGMTAADIKTSVRELDKISVRTISRALLHHLKMPSRLAAHKPLLTKKMMDKRLKFAKKYKDWTPEAWSKVMFSDESTFRCIRATRSRVRRPKEMSRYLSRYTVKTVKHPDQVMVWACFSGDVGRGGLYFLPRNVMMNGDRYLEVLQNHLIPFMEIHGSTHFLQDGAPCHKSKKVMDFLKDKPFEIMDWPGNSPDLNPIENAWNYMKNQLKKKDISSVPKLTEEIKKLWVTTMKKDYFEKLSESMPKRMRLVIQAHGDMTKY